MVLHKLQYITCKKIQNAHQKSTDSPIAATFLDRSNFLPPRTLKNWTDLEWVRGGHIKKKKLPRSNFLFQTIKKLDRPHAGARAHRTKLAWQS
jgi:hypothetical protein